MDETEEAIYRPKEGIEGVIERLSYIHDALSDDDGTSVLHVLSEISRDALRIADYLDLANRIAVQRLRADLTRARFTKQEIDALFNRLGFEELERPQPPF